MGYNEAVTLKVIRNLARKGFIIYTDHAVNERMIERDISREEVEDTLFNASKIVSVKENYIEKINKTLTSYRVRGGSKGIDIVVGIHIDDYLVVITCFKV